jgi:hypothetical protein
VAALVVIVVALGGGWLYQSRDSNKPRGAVSGAEAKATSTPAAVADAKSGYQKLKGRWLRPDGGYIVEVKSVADNGGMDAAYFNPKPIHVARAEASQADGVTKVFIELRDVNYPGSTYNLAYEPASDELRGIYYQAVQQQNFEVVFVRTN